MRLKRVIKVDTTDSLVTYEVQLDDVKLATKYGPCPMCYLPGGYGWTWMGTMPSGSPMYRLSLR